MPNGSYFLFNLLIFAFLILLVTLFLFQFVFLYNTYLQRKRYVENEIGRSEGEEKLHWIKKKKRLWRTFFPFLKD